MAEDLLIHDMAPMGDGVHQSERGRIYVERTLPGDRVQAKVHKAPGGILRGDVVQIVESSSHRVIPPCRHYDVCGGCGFQHAADAFYHDWKTGVVRKALEKRSLAPAAWHAPVFLPDSKRRRVTFAAFKKKNTVTLGYFRRRSHQVSDITACLVADPAIMALRKQLTTLLVPVLQDCKPADVFIQAVDGARELVITGPVGKKGFPDLQVHEAVAQIAQTANFARIAWRSRESSEPEVMVEVNPLYAAFGALSVQLPPLAFLQPTKAGEEALVAAVMQALPARGAFADLFSGSGTFTGPMLARGGVDAFDNVGAAIRALHQAGMALPLKVQQRDLYRNPLRPEELARYDALVFDPPRAGAEEQAKTLAVSPVPRLIAVSCNPVTFARDAQILIGGGYTLESVKVIDQFTWSHHVELVAVFTREI